MGITHANLIFGANHAERFNTAYLRAFDLERLLAAVEGCAHCGHHHRLPCGDIRGSAHDLGRLAVAEVYGGDMEMVAVGVLHACQHLADYNPP